ncbi:MAG: DoxX family protein [Parvibaculaceae bacterium]
MAIASSPRAAGPASLIERAVAILDRVPYALIALLARFSVGMVFLNSGLTKVEGFAVTESAVYLFREEYRLPLLPPELAAHLAAAIELTMPWLLFAGLGARFAALVLLAMTLVIEIFVYPSAYVTHGLWATALLLIVARGAGALSLDHLIARQPRGT